MLSYKRANVQTCTSPRLPLSVRYRMDSCTTHDAAEQIENLLAA